MDHLKESGIGASFFGQFGPKVEHEREATASSELELKIVEICHITISGVLRLDLFTNRIDCHRE